jgi:hypothetical protein
MNKYIPNTTQVPNIIFDEIMHNLSGNELKVLMFFIRQRYGFQKFSGSFEYSISQICNGIRKKDGTIICKGTGISNRVALAATETLFKKWHLIHKKSGDWVNKKSNKYELTIDDESSLKETTIDDEKSPSSMTNSKREKPVIDDESSLSRNKVIETKKEIYIIYGEYKNIKLTQNEYNKLYEKYNNNTKDIIEYLSAYKVEKSYKTKSDYLTILRWVAAAVLKDIKQQPLQPKKQKTIKELLDEESEKMKKDVNYGKLSNLQ